VTIAHRKGGDGVLMLTGSLFTALWDRNHTPSICTTTKLEAFEYTSEEEKYIRNSLLSIR
jgi:hypothetical protein